MNGKDLVNLINKKVGVPIAFTPSENPDKLKLDSIPTNVEEINDALGGGIPLGSVTLITGSQGSGKTSLIFSSMKNALDRGFICIYINAEPGWPVTSQVNAGLDINHERFLVMEPHTYGEQLVDGIYEVLRAQKLKHPEAHIYIAFDSINAFMPLSQVKREDEKGLGSVGMVERARALSDFMQRLAGQNMLGTNNVIVIVSQLRTTGFGGPVVSLAPSGGQAIQFMPKTRIDLKGKAIKEKRTTPNGAEVYKAIATEVSWEIAKNTATGNPPSAGKYTYTYPDKSSGLLGGIDDSAVMIQWITDNNILYKDGRAFFVRIEEEVIPLNTTKKDEVKVAINSNPELKERLMIIWKSRNNLVEVEQQDNIEQDNEFSETE